MAVLALADQLTALERLNRMEGDTDDARRIFESLEVTNQLYLDAVTMEANEGTVNTTVQRTALPKATHRVYNQGVATSASQTKVIHDIMCETAVYSAVDKSLIKQAADPDQFLMGEAVSFIQGMGQTQCEDILYGNHSLNAAQMDGFAARRDKIDDKLCIDMQGSTSGQLTSVYIVKWGRSSAHLIYPRGSQSIGVTRDDLGYMPWETEQGKHMQARVNYFQANYGLTVRDERSLIRLANIDPAKTPGEDIIKQILKSFHDLVPGEGTIAIYGSSSVLAMLDVATVDKNNVIYTDTDPWGRDLIKIRQGRVRQLDSLLETETKVTK